MAVVLPPPHQPGWVTRTARTVRTFAISLLVLFAIAATLAGVLFYRDVTTSLPQIGKLVEYQPPTTTQVLADDGTVIGEFYTEKRFVVPIDRIPQVVRQAFIAAEDDSFYDHGGIAPISILRAFINNAIAGGKVQGGSTITQQVVKSLLLSPKKSYERKLKEVLLATRIEGQLTKNEILYLYLNHIYLGSGAYGVAAAAREYFGKDVSQLTLAEAALLAGLPQAPSRYSPFKHWPRAKARQHYVLERMAQVGFISGADAVLAGREPLSLPSRKGSYITAPYYVEQVRRALEEKYGESAIYSLGLRVHTPLNLRLQAAAEEALRQGLRDLGTRQHYDGVFGHLEADEVDAFTRSQRDALKNVTPDPERKYDALVTTISAAGTVRVQIGPYQGVLQSTPGSRRAYRLGDLVHVRLAASDGVKGYQFTRDDSFTLQGSALVVDPRNGDVKAMIGGTNFDDSQFNRAIQSARQPGSAFKPLVYAAALDDKMTPASIIVDAPISFPDNNKVWSPHNYENRFYGPTTLREALTFSRNVPTVKLATQVGVKRLVQYVRQLGIRSPLEPNLSIALGSAEVTLVDLAGVYTAFAHQGERAEPQFIRKITDGDGNLIYEAAPQLQQVMSPETAYMITSILQGVIERGTGRRAREINRPAAGKTGTTNDMNDAWFIGYTPQLLAGFWMGFDEKRTLGKGETGGHAVAPVWLQFMEQALADEPVLDFPVPPGISWVPIIPATGKRTLPGAPGAMMECFRRGTEPPLWIAPPKPEVTEVAADLDVEAEQPSDTNSQPSMRANPPALRDEKLDDSGF